MTETIPASMLLRAQEMSADTGHTVSDCVDILKKRDAGIAQTIKDSKSKTQSFEDWNQTRIHGLHKMLGEEAGREVEAHGYLEDLLTGASGSASEDKVEHEVMAFLLHHGAMNLNMSKKGDKLKVGQLIYHRTSQSQRPAGMTKGIPDLLFTRYGVWPGWYGPELKARGKRGKGPRPSEVKDAQQVQADHGLVFLVWHVAHIAVLMFSLDKEYGWDADKESIIQKPKTNRPKRKRATKRSSKA